MAIVGNGDVASVLTDREDLTFFASGVSNSSCNDTDEFLREIDLLMKQDKSKRLVYFSTLSIYDKKTPYTTHKKAMEAFIKKSFNKWCIIRLGNITWGNNPNTFINFLKNNPNAPIRDEWKYLCNFLEFDYWINKIPDFNTEMNIPGERKKVIDCIR
jgi:hypothetical protein